MPSQSKTAAVHKALSGSEQQFQLLVQAVKDYAIFMLDPQGRITTWNSGAERIKGYRAEEIIGEHFSRFYTQEDQREGVIRLHDPEPLDRPCHAQPAHSAAILAWREQQP